MITISLCMIVRDEEDVLARCLDSVKDVVDEIVIVDTGSVDTTKEIAREYTERVYDFVWCDDFSKARNYAFDKGTMDYLFWLDADDVLPASSKEALLQLKETLDPDVSVVTMPYHVAFDELGKPRFVFKRERLLKREVGFRWRGAVHEAISYSGKVVHSNIVVEHRKLKQGDPDRNLHIFEKQIAIGADLEPRERFYYARELYYHKRYTEAIQEIESFLKMPAAWLENKLDAYRMIARCYNFLLKPEDAIQALLRSLAEDIPRAETCCEIGWYFMNRKDYRVAAFWYEIAASCQKSIQSGAFVDPDCYDYLPYIQLCVCYYWLGDIEKAKKYHRLAAEIKPETAAVKHNESFFASL